MFNKRKFKKLICNPKLYFVDAYKNKQKQLVVFLKKHEPFLKKNLYHVDKLVDVNVPVSSYYIMLHSIFEDMSHHSGAEKAIEKAISRKPLEKYYYQYGLYLNRRKLWWRAADALEKSKEISSKKELRTHLELAYTLETMGHFDKSVKTWGEVEHISNLTSYQYYRYGYVLEKYGQIDKANKKYKKAIELDKKNKANVLGIGIFHEKRGDWSLAAQAYKETSQENPLNANVYYKLALSLEKSYKWQEAEQEYIHAITLKPRSMDWHYRLGFVRERAGKYNKAKQAYEFASINRETHTPYWYYRLGFVLEKSGKFKESCEAFLMMQKIKLPTANSSNVKPSPENKIQNLIHLKNHPTYLDKEFNQKILKKSTDYLKRETEQAEEFNGGLHFSLGEALAFQGKYEEASKSFLEQRIIQSAQGAPESKFNKDQNYNQVVSYAEYFKRIDVIKNTIMYESFGGVGMSCNPYALFLSIIKDKRFQDWTHIWVIDDSSKIPEEYTELENFFSTTKDSDSYLKYLSSSEYLINNSTFPSYFIRKPNQKYLNTWHGTPLKTLGTDIKDAPYQRANTARNFLHTTHMITPNQHTTDVLINRYGINGVFHGNIAEIGYPRIDLVLNTTEERKKELIDMMGLDPKKPILLYAPTYRGLWDTPEIETDKILLDLKSLELDKFNLIFRGHYFTEQKITELNLPIKLAPHSIDSCELLSVVDVLISDYSSIFYDFLPTEKPIIHYVHDYDEYNINRGMYFNIDELPGTICHTIQDVLKTLEDIVFENTKDLSKGYRHAKQIFSLHEDGQSTRRAIDFFFFDKIKEKHLINCGSKKKTLLFYAPFELTGITSALISLTKNIDKTQYDVTVVVGRDSLVGHEDRIEKLNQLDNDINVLIRSGRMIVTTEEQWIRDKFSSYNKLESEEMNNIYKKSFEREFTRMFGYHTFHAIIDFNGYSPFWASIFSFGNSNNKSIYLHSDMHKENLLKYPYLKSTFNLYKNFDKLISVSESTSESNRNSLSNNYSIPKKSFYYCNNPISFQDFESLSNEAVLSSEYEFFLRDKRKKFINVGRLSPEKGQIKLIEAFIELLKKKKDIALYIMGTGLLYNNLKSIIEKNKVQKNIILLGHQSNPYPYIKNSDCMILSSKHEGQGIVLLEALFLNIPCISTDIPGPRSVLSDGHGILIGESTEDITQSLEKFLNSQYEFKSFDSLEYNQDALNMFYNNVAS